MDRFFQNMGMRAVELDYSFLGNPDGSGVLHVSQPPPNPAIMPPGPALAFVVINGVPSIGAQVMVGSGSIGQQPTSPNEPLPQSAITPQQQSQGPTKKGPGASVILGQANGNLVQWLKVAGVSMAVLVIPSLC